MAKPNNLPTSLAIPAGAPTDPLGQAMFLTNLSVQLNAWLAQAATAINYLLSKSS